MMVSERERNAYASNYDYDSRPNNRYSRYEDERAYDMDRDRTSPMRRDALMYSLERPASRSRLERTDENRYGFYMANIGVGENNYDKYWDEKHKSDNVDKNSARPKKRLAFMLTYIIVAIVALIAVTLSVVGLGEKTVVVSKRVETDTIVASAESNVNTGIAESAQIQEEEETAAVSGSEVSGINYIILANGELVEIEKPDRTVKAEEKEKGFDKFCTWLNGVFGG